MSTKRTVGLANLKVLIVDDDAATRAVLAEVLSDLGANAQVAGSAQEGMIAFNDFNPDILVCDICMPNEDGYSFIRRIRAHQAFNGANVPALALSALAGSGDRLRALSAGFQMHVTKPIDIEQLGEVVAKLAGRELPIPQASLN